MSERVNLEKTPSTPVPGASVPEAKADAALPTNGVNDDVMTQLLEMEVRAFEATGLIDELDDVPEGAELNAATSRIVAELKKKM